MSKSDSEEEEFTFETEKGKSGVPDNITYEMLKKKLEVILLKAEIFIKSILSKMEELDEGPSSKSKTKSKVKRRISECISLSEQPSILKNGELKNFQLMGLRWLYSLDSLNINGILADEMGLGKTIQVIALLGTIYQFSNREGPHLIICPKSVLSHWTTQISKWLPMLKVVKLRPSKDFREEPLKIINSNKFNVVVTTYEGIQICYNELRKVSWDYVIIDEALKLKKNRGVFSNLIRTFKCDHRLIMTGTPFQNNLHELWCLLNYLMPEIFQESLIFDSLFSEDMRDSGDDENLEIANKLKHLIRPFFLKRTKEEVLKEIPPKKEIHLLVGMTDLQINLYSQVIQNRGIIYRNESKTHYNNVLMQLRKICLHPYLFPDIEEENSDPYGSHLVEASGKFLLLDKILKKLKQENHRVLIFSQFCSLLNILEDYLISQHFKYHRIDGTTTLEDRDNQIDEFNSPGSETFIFLISTRAGGVGINLASADVVILFDSDYNPQMDLQAIDRAHRIGQTKEVTVFRLITENSIEEKIIERQIKRRILDKFFIRDAKLANDANIVTKESLINMISYGANSILTSTKGTYTDEDIDTLIKEGEKRFLKTIEEVENMKELNSFSDLNIGNISLYSKSLNTNVIDADDLALKMAILQKEEEELYTGRRTRIRKDKENIEKIERDKAINAIGREFKLKFPEYHFYEKRDKLYDLYLKQNLENSNDVLTEEEEKEMDEIIKTGLTKWKHHEFQSYLSVCEKHGSKDYDSLIKHLPEKSLEEIKTFEEKLLKFHNQLSNVKLRVRNIIKANKKFEEKSNLNSMVENIKKMFSDNETGLDLIKFPKRLYYTKKTEESFNNEQDKVLLREISKGKYGEWKEILSVIHSIKKFRFHFHLPTISPDSVQKRAQQLLRFLISEESLKQNYWDNILKKKPDADSITESTITPVKSEDPMIQKTLEETIGVKEAVDEGEEKKETKNKVKGKKKREKNPSTSTKKRPKKVSQSKEKQITNAIKEFN